MHHIEATCCGVARKHSRHTHRAPKSTRDTTHLKGQCRLLFAAPVTCSYFQQQREKAQTSRGSSIKNEMRGTKPAIQCKRKLGTDKAANSKRTHPGSSNAAGFSRYQLVRASGFTHNMKRDTQPAALCVFQRASCWPCLAPRSRHIAASMSPPSTSNPPPLLAITLPSTRKSRVGFCDPTRSTYVKNKWR